MGEGGGRGVRGRGGMEYCMGGGVERGLRNLDCHKQVRAESVIPVAARVLNRFGTSEQPPLSLPPPNIIRRVYDVCCLHITVGLTIKRRFRRFHNRS